MTPEGVVTTLAGLAGSSGSADGTGSDARFYDPTGVATDSAGNVYVADQSYHTIRKVTPGGVVTTLAGLAGSSGSSDGTGSAARFNSPHGVASDSAGNVYVADWSNQTIRKVSRGGVVTTLAGLAGSYGNADGTGSVARFSNPRGVATDSVGNVYVAEFSNHTIRAGGKPESPTQHLEAEVLEVQAISPVPAGFLGTWYGVFNSAAASGGSAAAFNATAVGNYVTYTVPVTKAGTYHVRVGVQTKSSKGIFQLAINGVNQGSPQDEYSPTITYGMRDLGTVTLSSGNQAFKFYVTGKNPSSPQYNLVFDYIELVP